MSTVHPPTSEVSPSTLGVGETVYQHLLRMLMQNVVAPGSRMIIDKIAAELKVSSTPVREALARLETQGLVTKERLRGYFAAEFMRRPEFDDLWDFRLMLEPIAARRAATRASRTDRLRLDAELAEILPVRLEDDYASKLAVREHDQRLHDLIFELAGNSHARQAMARCHVHNRMLRVHFAAVDGYHAIQEHVELVTAVSSGDPDEAEAAMRTHIENAYARLAVYFD